MPFIVIEVDEDTASRIRVNIEMANAMSLEEYSEAIAIDIDPIIIEEYQPRVCHCDLDCCDDD